MQVTKREIVERSLITSWRSRLWRPFIRAIKDYELIKSGDRIAVMMSGGKDSFLLAKLFEELYRHGKRNFEMVLINMDPGYAEKNRAIIEENNSLLEFTPQMYERDVFAVTQIMDTQNPCYLCARMRRGVLYDLAKKHGCNKIALGHHYDDVIETALMNVLVGGITMAMMPKLHSTSHKNMELIRPLYYVREKDIINWQKSLGLSFLDCACSIASKDLSSTRRIVKELIPELKKKFPQVEEAIFHSTRQVHTGAILGTVVKGVHHSFLESYDDDLDDNEEEKDSVHY